MNDKIRVIAINISEKKGTIKKSVRSIFINEKGLEGDAHSGTLNREVSLLSKFSVNKFEQKTGRAIKHGEFAENTLMEGIDFKKVYLLDKFRIGKIILEITQIGKKCHGDNCTIFKEVGECVMPKEGIFARILHTGKISKNDEVEYIPKKLKIKIITLSDRASLEVYEDISGKNIEEILTVFLKDKKWCFEIEKRIIPDNPLKLKSEINVSLKENTDFIITTGGTGISPKDCTVKVIEQMADKIISGIMEYIRIKYEEKNPNALLSGSIAAIIKKTIVFSIPGSPKAVTEYMGEILKIFEHSLLMINNLNH